MSQKITHALLIRKSSISPLRWTVQYRGKELYFESFSEAMKFCKGLMKEKNKNEN